MRPLRPADRLEIIDNQAGLLCSVHVEPRFAAFHLDLVLGPYTGLQIDVGLVLFGSLLPRPGEVKIRIRTVLGGVIPPDLIVSSPIRGSEIDVLVSSVALDTKSDANEPAAPTNAPATLESPFPEVFRVDSDSEIMHFAGKTRIREKWPSVGVVVWCPD